MRFSVAVVMAWLSISALSAAEPAPAVVRQSTNIPAQSLGSALQILAKQRAFQVVYLSDAVDALRTQGASGELTSDEALKQLLSGTGLSYRYLDKTTVTVFPANAPQAKNDSSDASSADKSEPVALRIAQTTGSAPNSDSGKSDASADTSDNKLQEIVVTAQKRQERLQDVPITISVLRGADLDSSPIQGIAEALKGIPGVADYPASRGANTPMFIVRGVAANFQFANGPSTIGYYLDSIPFGLPKAALSPEANPYDLDRIEVLRGPQGTLYGMSALNGVVRILTKDADLSAFDLKGRASMSSIDRGGDSYRGDLAVNVPLVEDKLALRAVLGRQDLGGWIDRPNAKDANDSKINTGRLKLNAKPTDALSIGLSAWFSRGDYGAPPISPDGYRTPVVRSEPSVQDYDAYNAKIDYQFSGVSLTSATSYMDLSTHILIDFTTYLNGFDSYFDHAEGGKVFSQEFNLASTQAGPWQWTAGGIYRDAKEVFVQKFIPIIPDLFADKYRSESFAVFGELRRLLADGRFEVTGGLRYFEDKVTDTDNIAPGSPSSKTSHFDNVSPRVVLNWHPSAQTTVYGSYSEGFRSGLNQSGGVQRTAPSIGPAEPDTLKNYEIGAKSSLWGGRASVETALFYMDWQDVQQTLSVAVTNSLIPAFVNAPSASGMGFEVAARVEPIDDLTLSASFGWNDLKIDEDMVNASATGPVIQFEKGSRLNFSPETTAAASADYTFHLAGGGFRGRLSTSASYVSEMLTGAGVATRLVGDSMLLARAAFAVEFPDRWVATLFAENLLNNNDVSARDAALNIWDPRVQPRTIGLQVEYRFSK